MRISNGGWLAVSSRIQTGNVKTSILQRFLEDGTWVYDPSDPWPRAINPEQPNATTIPMQFYSEWSDLGNGIALGVQAQTNDNILHIKVNGLTDTRSDAFTYQNAPWPVEPVYPDGPLWYVSEPGMVEKWIPAFVYDGIGWQPCRMWDGTQFMVSTIPLP